MRTFETIGIAKAREIAKAEFARDIARVTGYVLVVSRNLAESSRARKFRYLEFVTDNGKVSYYGLIGAGYVELSFLHPRDIEIGDIGYPVASYSGFDLFAGTYPETATPERRAVERVALA